MKILYAIQGTGNGHLSRARDVIEILKTKGELDILVSGTENEVHLDVPVKYTFKGLSFVFGKQGGIDLLATYKKGNLKRLFKEIKSLPVEQYDLVISDFEPVSAWACRMKNKPCIGLSNQVAVINKKSPKSKKTDPLGKSILKNYAPVTEAYGYHFRAYDKDIYTPLIRKRIRQGKNTFKGHYLVYLPAHGDNRIIKVLSEIPGIKWSAYSKTCKQEYKCKNIHFKPVNNEAFIIDLLSCTGIICAAGFQTPAEALFLEKNLLVIPMKGQYEQQCNAMALKEMGVIVLKSLKHKHLNKIKNWIIEPKTIHVNYPDLTETIINRIISKHTNTPHKFTAVLGNIPYSVKKFRQLSLGKILLQISS